MRCDHFAIPVFIVLSFAFAAPGATRAKAKRRQSTAGALRLGAGRASGGDELVVAPPVALISVLIAVLVLAVALLTLLVVLVLGVTLLVVTLLVVGLLADIRCGSCDDVRRVVL